MHLAVGNQWGLIGMPMAQVKTIKKEEKCLTTLHTHTPMLTQRPRRDRAEGRKKERRLEKYEAYWESWGGWSAEFKALTLETVRSCS